MPKTPRISGAKAVQAFERAGFFVSRTRGSHHIMKRSQDAVTITIPVHAGCTVGTGLLASQIKASGLTTQEFIDLL